MNRTIRKAASPVAKTSSATASPASKFTDAEIICKNQLRLLRQSRKVRMKEGAEMLGISLKQLEDLESTRPYGCHVSWDHIHAAAKAYKVSADFFMTASLG